jgi:hypothetical protein
MEELLTFVKSHQPIVAAVIGGLFAIIAAIIRRDRSARPGHQKKPLIKLVMISLITLVVGAGLLAAERFVMPFDPETRTLIASPDSEFVLTQAPAPASPFKDPGSLLLLGGWLCVVAGGVWLFINLIRLKYAHKKGKELATSPDNPSSVPVVPVATPRVVATPRKPRP